MFSAASSAKSSGKGSGTRRVYFTEIAEDEEIPADEVLETTLDVEQPGDDALETEERLEDLLQAEAECLASEIQEAEDAGVDVSVLQSVEADFESGAEALITMKEARSPNCRSSQHGPHQPS